MSWIIWEFGKKGFEYGLRKRREKQRKAARPNRPENPYPGILKPVVRQPLSTERRGQYLKLLFSWPQAHEYAHLRRLGNPSLSNHSERTLRAGTMATILFQWRGIKDPPDYFDRIALGEALIRDAMFENGETACARSMVGHGLEPLQDDEIVSLYKLFGSGKGPAIRRTTRCARRCWTT